MEIEFALFVLTPSMYGAARRDAPKIEKIQKNFHMIIKKIKIKYIGRILYIKIQCTYVISFGDI